jgi:hypothetical protein
MNPQVSTQNPRVCVCGIFGQSIDFVTTNMQVMEAWLKECKESAMLRDVPLINDPSELENLDPDAQIRAQLKGREEAKALAEKILKELADTQPSTLNPQPLEFLP